MISRCVMSLLTQKSDDRGYSPTDALLWGLSFNLARRHFEKLEIYTDDDGAKFLVDDLGLKFDRVWLKLNNLSGNPIWSIGKIKTYALQKEPFIHIDYDVFLWKQLPTRILDASLVAERPERFTLTGRESIDGNKNFSDFYHITRFVDVCKTIPKSWIPPGPGVYLAYNAGILGGNAVDKINSYAELSLSIIEADPCSKIITPTELALLFEQYAFGAQFGEEVETLFEDVPDEELATRIGYTHLVGSSKRRLDHRKEIFRILQRDFPDTANRVTTLMENPVNPPTFVPRSKRKLSVADQLRGLGGSLDHELESIRTGESCNCCSGQNDKPGSR